MYEEEEVEIEEWKQGRKQVRRGGRRGRRIGINGV